MTTYDIGTDPTKPLMQGDTFNGAVFTVTVNGTPLDLTLSSIRMDVRTNRDADPEITLTNGDGLTIHDPTAGKFKIEALLFPMESGIYLYDIQITIGSTVKTWIKGRIQITQDVTHV